MALYKKIQSRGGIVHRAGFNNVWFSDLATDSVQHSLIKPPEFERFTHNCEKKDLSFR